MGRWMKKAVTRVRGFPGVQRSTGPTMGSWAMARNDCHGNAGAGPAVPEESMSRPSNSRPVNIGGRLAWTARPRQETVWQEDAKMTPYEDIPWPVDRHRVDPRHRKWNRISGALRPPQGTPSLGTAIAPSSDGEGYRSAD